MRSIELNGNNSKEDTKRRNLVVDDKYLPGMLWTAFRQAQDKGDLGTATEFLWKFYDECENGAIGGKVISVFENAQRGGFSFFDPTREYSHGEDSPLFVKSVTQQYAKQALMDWLYIEKSGGQKFRLAPVEAYFPHPQQNLALLVTEIIVAPTISKVFRALNYKAQYEPEAEVIKDLLVKKRIEDLAWWVNNMHNAVPEPERIEMSRRETIVSTYQNNIINAFEGPFSFTKIGKEYFTLSHLERDVLQKALGIYDTLNLEGNRITRTMDDNEGNSGVEMPKMKYSSIKELADELFENLTFEHAGVRQASADEVYRRLGHWDIPLGFSHKYDGLIRIIDSASGQHPQRKKSEWIMSFDNSLPEDSTDLDSKLCAFALIGGARNLRQRAVVIAGYAVRNEERAAKEGLTDYSLKEKRKKYTEDSGHYATMALAGFEQSIDNYSQQLTIRSRELPPDYYELKLTFDNVKKLLDRGRFSPKQPDILDTSLALINKKMNSDDPLIRGLASLMTLYTLTAKAAKYDQIDFANLPKSTY